jgi:hypothetical protein
MIYIFFIFGLAAQFWIMGINIPSMNYLIHVCTTVGYLLDLLLIILAKDFTIPSLSQPAASVANSSSAVVVDQQPQPLLRTYFQIVSCVINVTGMLLALGLLHTILTVICFYGASDTKEDSKKSWFRYRQFQERKRYLTTWVGKNSKQKVAPLEVPTVSNVDSDARDVTFPSSRTEEALGCQTGCVDDEKEISESKIANAWEEMKRLVPHRLPQIFGTSLILAHFMLMYYWCQVRNYANTLEAQ